MDQSPLLGWESFYVVVGTGAAALIGLQFVVIVLSAEMHALGSSRTTRAFATPTIVHFCAVLFISAVLSAPWPALTGAGIALDAAGLAGLLYAAMVVRQALRQHDYELVLEDWVWHIVLPLLAYAALLVDGVLLDGNTMVSLFVIGGIAVLLLFIGIHNAWDSVVYIALQHRQGQNERADRS